MVYEWFSLSCLSLVFVFSSFRSFHSLRPPRSFRSFRHPRHSRSSSLEVRSVLPAWSHEIDVTERSCRAKLRSLLVEHQGVLRPFHASFFDWLNNSDSAGRFYVRKSHGHKLIGDWVWSKFQHFKESRLGNRGSSNGVLPRYIVRNGLKHLEEAAKVQ